LQKPSKIETYTILMEAAPQPPEANSRVRSSLSPRGESVAGLKESRRLAAVTIY
jgi:hypothetical protein